MTRLPQPPLPDKVARQLNADGDEARISREAAEAGHRLLEIEGDPSLNDEMAEKMVVDLVAGGQGRGPQDIIDGATVIAFVLAAAGLAAAVLVIWRAVGGAA